MGAIVWPSDPVEAFAAARRLACGFVPLAVVEAAARDERTRLKLLLVRCGGCRFLAPAQDVGRITAALEAAGEYVRDVSLPAGVWS